MFSLGTPDTFSSRLSHVECNLSPKKTDRNQRKSVLITTGTTRNILKVPINPKFLFRLNKSFYNSEQNGTNNFVFGQNRNFL